MARETVLVTGGTGFIGRHLVKRLVAEGRHVFVTGREAVPHGADLLAPDFQDVTADMVKGLSTVWHLAAETDTRAPDDEQWTVNCDDAANFIALCRDNGVERVVYTSSCAVYGSSAPPFSELRAGEPLNAYGAAKLALDKIASSKAVAIRPSNVYGPGEEHKGRSSSYLAQIVAAVRSSVPVELYPECARDLVAVDDVADALLWAERFRWGIYNVGSGVPVDYSAVPYEVGRLLQRSPTVTRKVCPFGAEFQIYTAANVAKLRRACEDVGRVWNPADWRSAVARYLLAGWPVPSAAFPPSVMSPDK